MPEPREMELIENRDWDIKKILNVSIKGTYLEGLIDNCLDYSGNKIKNDFGGVYFTETVIKILEV